MSDKKPNRYISAEARVRAEKAITAAQKHATHSRNAQDAATDAVKKFSKSALNLASDAAPQVQERLAQRIHKVMGSDEYKQKALDVNARLTNALASLEDSIKRRDLEIAQLRLRVSELERQIREGSS